MRYAIVAALLLSGCSGTIYKDRIVHVNVPVPQPCVGERPAPVTTLKQDFTDAEWQAMDIRQKSAAVGKKALDRQAYGESLDAATGACQ